MRSFIKIAVLVLVLLFPITAVFCADLVLTDGAQDGFVNDSEYSRSEKFILAGEEGFTGIFEFQLKSRDKVKKAILVFNVKKVKKKGEFALYHLKAFNNGEAEVQDYFASASPAGKKLIEKEGPVEFDVTKCVREDIAGPGEYTSYRLAAVKDGQIVIESFESGKDCAVIKTER